MLLTMLVSMLVGAEPTFGPTTPPETTECVTEPMQLELHEFVMSGNVMTQVVKQRCRVNSSADAVHFYITPTRVGTRRLATFQLFGRQLGLDLNAMVVASQPGGFSFGQNAVLGPGQNGQDFYYVAPGLDLPDDWERALERTTTPILVLGGAAILTTVIVNLAKGAK